MKTTTLLIAALLTIGLSTSGLAYAFAAGQGEKQGGSPLTTVRHSTHTVGHKHGNKHQVKHHKKEVKKHKKDVREHQTRKRERGHM